MKEKNWEENEDFSLLSELNQLEVKGGVTANADTTKLGVPDCKIVCKAATVTSTHVIE